MGFSPSPPPARRASVRAPVLLITLGVMFLVNELVVGWGISKTWPILLVVGGVLMLIDSTRPPRPPQGPRV